MPARCISTSTGKPPVSSAACSLCVCVSSAFSLALLGTNLPHLQVILAVLTVDFAYQHARLVCCSVWKRPKLKWEPKPILSQASCQTEWRVFCTCLNAAVSPFDLAVSAPLYSLADLLLVFLCTAAALVCVILLFVFATNRTGATCPEATGFLSFTLVSGIILCVLSPFELFGRGAFSPCRRVGLLRMAFLVKHGKQGWLTSICADEQVRHFFSRLRRLRIQIRSAIPFPQTRPVPQQRSLVGALGVPRNLSCVWISNSPQCNPIDLSGMVVASCSLCYTAIAASRSVPGLFSESGTSGAPGTGGSESVPILVIVMMLSTAAAPKSSAASGSRVATAGRRARGQRCEVR